VLLEQQMKRKDFGIYDHARQAQNNVRQNSDEHYLSHVQTYLE